MKRVIYSTIIIITLVITYTVINTLSMQKSEKIINSYSEVKYLNTTHLIEKQKVSLKEVKKEEIKEEIKEEDKKQKVNKEIKRQEIKRQEVKEEIKNKDVPKQNQEIKQPIQHHEQQSPTHTPAPPQTIEPEPVVKSARVSYFALNGYGLASMKKLTHPVMYGEYRVLAASRKDFKFGSLIKINGTALGDIVGIVLDRGDKNIGLDSRFAFDILVYDDKEAYTYGVSKVTYEVLRNGW